jgi:hypothetical protein
VSSRPELSSLHAASGDCPSLVDLDQLPEVADAPPPPNQYSSEPVVPNENSFDVRLRLELPPLGGQFRHRSSEGCLPYLRADRRLADDWCVMDSHYRTHNDSFSIDLRLTSSELERRGGIGLRPDRPCGQVRMPFDLRPRAVCRCVTGRFPNVGVRGLGRSPPRKPQPRGRRRNIGTSSGVPAEGSSPVRLICANCEKVECLRKSVRGQEGSSAVKHKVAVLVLGVVCALAAASPALADHPGAARL